MVALFYTLSFGFAAGSDRTLQAFLERYVEMADCEELSYAAFHEWFEPTFVALPREILDTGRADLNRRLERFRDVLIADGTVVSLYEDATDVYAATDEDQAGLKLHLTKSLSTGLPTWFQTTDAKTQERSQLPTGEWVAGALVLLDLGFYDFWLFDRIDANDGWFVSRVKDDANFEIVEKLRTWRGNSIPLEGESLKDVLDDLQRQEIDVRITLSFELKRGSCGCRTRTFRLVDLRNDRTEEYHLYLTNLDREAYSAPDIAQLYRTRWEVELLFKELKSRFGLNEINTTDAYIIEALIIMAGISLMMSQVIVDELRKLEAKQREAEDADADSGESASRLSRRRCSLAIERHAHLHPDTNQTT
jgi:IS4 transposase